MIIPQDLRIFIHDITLFLQNHGNYSAEKIEPMFQRAYKLYVKYDVENEQANPPDCEHEWQGVGEQVIEDALFCPLCKSVRNR